MGETSETRERDGLKWWSDAAVMIVVLLLVFAAFDDITTDNATAFPVEYSMLAAAAAWLLRIAWTLLRNGYRFLGGMSVFAVATAVWAQRAIGPGVVPGWRPDTSPSRARTCGSGRSRSRCCGGDGARIGASVAPTLDGCRVLPGSPTLGISCLRRVVDQKHVRGCDFHILQVGKHRHAAAIVEGGSNATGRW